MLEPDAGYSAEQIAQARELAAGALIRHRDSGSPKQPPLTAADRRRLVEFVSGAPIDDDAESLYEAELALDGADLRRPTWTVSEIAPRARVTVGIVGAGMSGIIAAHRPPPSRPSRSSCFEKNEEVGGTWLENDYPGLPRRHPEPLLQLRDRADAGLAAVPLDAAGAARLLPYVHRAFRRRGLHSLFHRKC